MAGAEDSLWETRSGFGLYAKSVAAKRVRISLCGGGATRNRDGVVRVDRRAAVSTNPDSVARVSRSTRVDRTGVRTDIDPPMESVVIVAVWGDAGAPVKGRSAGHMVAASFRANDCLISSRRWRAAKRRGVGLLDEGISKRRVGIDRGEGGKWWLTRILQAQSHC